MHFDLPEEISKEDLDRITSEAIAHCVEVHCTCDAHVGVEELGLIIYQDDVQAIGKAYVTHSSLCFSSGRDN